MMTTAVDRSRNSRRKEIRRRAIWISLVLILIVYKISQKFKHALEEEARGEIAGSLATIAHEIARSSSSSSSSSSEERGVEDDDDDENIEIRISSNLDRNGNIENDFKGRPSSSSPMPPDFPSERPNAPVAPLQPPPDDIHRKNSLTKPIASSTDAEGIPNNDHNSNNRLGFFKGNQDEPREIDREEFKSVENDVEDIWVKRRRELFDVGRHPYVDEDDLDNGDESMTGEREKRFKSLDKVLNLRDLRRKFPPHTMERVELGSESPLHVTFATVELLTMVENWLTYSVRAKIPKIVVVSLDRALHDWCEEELVKQKKMNVRRSNSDSTNRNRNNNIDDDNDDDDDLFACVPGEHLLDKSKLGHSLSGGFREVKESFYALMNVKIQIIETFLLNGYDLLISDADVTWVRNPMPYFNTGNLGKSDIAVSADCVFHFRGDLIDQEEIEAHRKLKLPQLTTTVFQKWEHWRDEFTQLPWPYLAEYNTGIMLLRATLESVRFAKDWKHGMEAGKMLQFANDQHHFNAIVRSRWLQRKSLPAFCKKLTSVGEKSSMCRKFDKPTADNRHPDNYFKRQDKTYDPSKPNMTVMDDDFSPRDKEGLCEPVMKEVLERVKNGPPSDGYYCEKYPPDFEAFPEDYKRGLRPLYSYGGTSGSLRVAKLPTSLFSNGMVFFMGKEYSKRSIIPFGVHNTYVYDGAQGKIWRFRESGMWADKKTYFLQEHQSSSTMKEEKKTKNEIVVDDLDKVMDDVLNGGDITQKLTTTIESNNNDLKTLVVRMSIPEWLEKSVNESISTPKGTIPIGHMNGLRWQLARVRDAIAIAKMLNRALIMPQFICGCHRHFNLLTNCTMGAMTIPFVCPIDHWALPRTFENLPVPIRETSYFENRVNAGFEPFKNAAPRIAICSQDETESACKARKGAMRGALPHLPGFARTQTPIDEGDAKLVIKTGFNNEMFQSKIRNKIVSLGLDDEPVLVLDGLGDFAADQFVDHGSKRSDFVGFASKDENLSFDHALGRTTHQWCCYINGTVEHPFPRLHK